MQRPRCCCMDIKVGLMVFIGLFAVLGLGSFATSHFFQGIGSLALSALGIYAVYSENVVLLKVYSGISVVGLVIFDVLMTLGLIAFGAAFGASEHKIRGRVVSNSAFTVALAILVTMVALLNLITIPLIWACRRFYKYLEFVASNPNTTEMTESNQ